MYAHAPGLKRRVAQVASKWSLEHQNTVESERSQSYGGPRCQKLLRADRK